jgi:predicted lipoprotein with Yx(FWY)xxD motif
MKPRFRRLFLPLIAGVAGLSLAAVTGLALAKTHTTLGTASNAALGKTIVVDSRGLTVYELKGENSHHLLCRTQACFKLWPPVKVASRKSRLTAASGVTGRLGIMHRSGFFQVTLGGHPLYRFAGDSATKGKATGEGIMGFGGTWHVVAASSKQPTSTGTTTNTTPTNPYGY